MTDDARERAERALSGPWVTTERSLLSKTVPYDLAVDAIAQEIQSAVAEERERCARVVEAAPVGFQTNLGVVGDIPTTLRQAIARAIREGG